MDTNHGDWTLVLKPDRKLLQVNLKDLWRYRDLILLFVRRDFLSTYKQTILGPVWFVVQPILSTIMFTIIFSRIAKIPTDGIPPILFYLTGLTFWNYFASCLTKTSDTFNAHAHLFSKVYFPRLAVPFSIVISNTFTFAIQFSLLFLIFFFFKITGTPLHIQPSFVLFPFLILLTGLLGLGMGIIISSFTTKYKDLTHLFVFGVQLFMYATPIIYPLSQVTGVFRTLILLNPVTPIVENFRYSLLGTGGVESHYLLYSLAFAITSLFIGTVLFNKVEKNFMDVV